MQPGRIASGLARLKNTFDQTRAEGRAALMPYFTLGYPDPLASLAIIEAIAPYSDLLELGLPFSDPIADGPTIQRSTQRALERGMTINRCLALLEELQRRGLPAPALLMGYYNPILAFGEEQFVERAAAAGAAGLIVPDLPPEEAGSLAEQAARCGLALIRFVAPTTSPKRLASIVEQAQGFIYLVSLTGTTGARSALNRDLQALVETVRAQTDLPVAVGFGIGTAQQAAEVGAFADGVIIGSALVEAVDKADDKPAAAATFVKTMRQALASQLPEN